MTNYTFAETKGAKSAPLVFTFHGTGGSEQQFHGFASELSPTSAVVSPRGDVSEMGALRYFRRTAEGVYDMDDLAQRTAAMAAFLTTQKNRLTPLATWAFGYSNGANILASVAATHPNIVDRIALLHPLIPFTPPPQPGLKGRSVLITAGRRDPICPASQTQALADWLTTQDAEVTLEWHNGGHEIHQSEVNALAAFFSTSHMR